MIRTQALRGLFVGALLLGAGGAQAELLDVGTAAAVNPDVTGTPPGQQTRELFVGSEVFFDERISTRGKGQTQILFVDESTLTISPNSDVVLDVFAYDPATSTGKLIISLGKGLLRYVGGKISKQAGVTINTPNAVIGVRGGISIVGYQQDTGTSAVFPFGTGSVTPTGPGGATGQTTTVSGGDTAVLVDSGGGVEETDASALVDSQLAAFEGTGGDTSGGDVTDTTTTEALTATPVASTEPVVEPSTTTTSGSGGSGTGGTDGDPASDTSNDVNNATQNTATEAAAGGLNLPGPFPGNFQSTPPASPPAPTPYTTDFGTLVTDPFGSNVIGGTDPDFNRPFTSSSIANGVLMADTDGIGGDDFQAPVQVGEFAVAAADTVTPIGPASGTGFFDPDIPFYF